MAFQNNGARAGVRNTTISDIRGNSSEFPKIHPSANHIVLCDIKGNNGNEIPCPLVGDHVWNSEYVKMPFSDKNTYPINQNGQTITARRWDLIVQSLRVPITDSVQLENAILKYNYNYRNEWKFFALHRLFDKHLKRGEIDKFFGHTLPFMINLALNLPNILLAPIPLLKQHQKKSVSLSQYQIASLLANAFLCTFPHRNKLSNSEYSKFPRINFSSLFMGDGSNRVMEKLKCILHYFNRLSLKIPCGVVTFTRHFVRAQNCPDWRKSNKKIGSIPVFADSSGTIEDNADGLLQVDFANKFVGGGVLRNGCVQEEIRFVICPELLVSLLFTEVLDSTEAFSIIGCERYSNYSGYSDSFKWTNDHVDQTARDSNGRLKCGIIAIDAINFGVSSLQYEPENINRELNKAWVGFSAGVNNHGHGFVYPGIATGNWGCGAFRGSPQLKFLLQMMACCEAQRPLAHFSFGNSQLSNDILHTYKRLSESELTIGSLYNFLIGLYKSGDPQGQLFSKLLNHIGTPGRRNNVNQRETIPYTGDRNRPRNRTNHEDSDCNCCNIL